MHVYCGMRRRFVKGISELGGTEVLYFKTLYSQYDIDVHDCPRKSKNHQKQREQRCTECNLSSFTTNYAGSSASARGVAGLR